MLAIPVEQARPFRKVWPFDPRRPNLLAKDAGMHGATLWLTMGAAFLAFALVAGWAGVSLGRRAARKYPGLAIGLILFSSFFRLDPPPPPRAERIIKDEEDEAPAGAPPRP